MIARNEEHALVLDHTDAVRAAQRRGISTRASAVALPLSDRVARADDALDRVNECAWIALVGGRGAKLGLTRGGATQCDPVVRNREALRCGMTAGARERIERASERAVVERAVLGRRFGVTRANRDSDPDFATHGRRNVGRVGSEENLVGERVDGCERVASSASRSCTTAVSITTSRESVRVPRSMCSERTSATARANRSAESVCTNMYA
jgi:hypothetical protein